MIRIRRAAVLLIALTLSAIAQPVGIARACPNCKEAVSLQSGEASNVASGYNWSVLFMIAVPFSMMGTGALAIRRAVKRGSLPEM
jgi:hypothetical protein